VPPLFVQRFAGGAPTRVEARWLTDFSGGDVVAVPVDGRGVTPQAGPLWSARAAFAAVPPEQRVMLTLHADGRGIPLRWADLDPDAQATLAATSSGLAPGPATEINASLGMARIDWLRGGRGAEARAATGEADLMPPSAGTNAPGVASIPGDTTGTPSATASGTRAGSTADLARPVLRARPHGPPGAVVHGAPWWLPPPSAGHAADQAPGYPAFRLAWLRRPQLLFFGAEDGLLHAVRMDDGAPVMAYLPRALHGQVAALTTPDQPHRAWVDGVPFTADVNLDGTTTGWRTLLFAPFGRGAPGLAMLEVTSATFTTAGAATSVRGEFTLADDPDLGHLIDPVGQYPLTGQPRSVVRLANGRSALLVGNGDGSATGQAALYILYLDRPPGRSQPLPPGGAGGRWRPGSDFRKLVAGRPVPGNGLGVPFPVDSDGAGRIDVVYAADRSGRIWKFDLSAPDDTAWGVAFEGAPLYAARSRLDTTPLPLRAAPLVMPHPLGGQIVVFGTGNWPEGPVDRAVSVRSSGAAGSASGSGSASTVSAGNAAEPVQTLFALWDRPGATTPPAAGRERLLRQEARVVPESGAVTVSTVQVHDWSAVDGWYLDLPGAGERLLLAPEAVGQAVLFHTVLPGAAAGRSPDPCASGWDGRFWLLDVLNGARLANGFGLDRDGDGRAETIELISAGAVMRETPAAVRIPDAVTPTGRAAGGRLLVTPSGVEGLGLRVPGPRGRIAWRELDP